jgi:hypothetical protein
MCSLEIGQQSPCALLRGLGVADSACRDVPQAGIETSGQFPRGRKAALVVMAASFPLFFIGAAVHLRSSAFIRG